MYFRKLMVSLAFSSFLIPEIKATPSTLAEKFRNTSLLFVEEGCFAHRIWLLEFSSNAAPPLSADLFELARIDLIRADGEVSKHPSSKKLIGHMSFDEQRLNTLNSALGSFAATARTGGCTSSVNVAWGYTSNLRYPVLLAVSMLGSPRLFLSNIGDSTCSSASDVTWSRLTAVAFGHIEEKSTDSSNNR